ncbi:MAG: HAD family phosphatase [Erysipelotrichia bacterium]|nr:HAD family phosphatase [Erysipelotrichia bacterium]
MIKAIIFDMDGLMFDTEKLFEVLFFKVCKEHDFYCTKEAFLSMVGVSAKTVSKLESQFLGISKIMEEVQQRRKAFFFEYFKEAGSANKKGLKELYEYAKKHGYKLAVASSSQKEDIVKFINHAGFSMEFDAIVSGYDGLPSKPAPDIFMKAAKMLALKNEECLVLEDSKFGTMAAYHAHMPHVFIQDMIAPDEEMKPYIDISCDSMLDVITLLEKQ